MRSLPLRHSAGDQLRLPVPLRCSSTAADPGGRSQARPGPQHGAAARRSRSARSGRSPTTIAASPGSSSVPRMLRRTPTPRSRTAGAPTGPTCAGRSLLERAAPTARSARASRRSTRGSRSSCRRRPARVPRRHRTLAYSQRLDPEPPADLPGPRHPDLRVGARCDRSARCGSGRSGAPRRRSLVTRRTPCAGPRSRRR